MKKEIGMLKQWLEQEQFVLLAFLFGSAAKGRETAESDIDIAVYLKDKKKEDLVWNKAKKIFGREIDLVLLNDAPASLISNVFKTGVPLTIKDRRLFSALYLENSMEAEDFAGFASDYWMIAQRSASLSPEDRVRVLERLTFLRNEMQEHQEMAKVSIEEYEKNKLKRRNLERWAENIINAMIDIAKIILASEEKEMPKSYGASLEEFGILAGMSKPEAEKLSALSRLRNLLAHEYLEILHGKLQEFVKDIPPLYAKIMLFMKNYHEPGK